MKETNDLTLEQMLRNDLPIYVRNNSNPISKVCISMTLAGGPEELCIIPPHRYPVCLSEQYPAQTLYQSADLRKQVGMKLVVLVEPETARKELSDPKIVAYLNKRYASAFALGSGTTSPEAMAMAQTMQNVKDEVGANEGDEEASRGDVSPKVVGLIDMLEAPDANLEDILFDLQNMESNLNEDELLFILSKVGTRFPDVVAWAEEAYKKANPQGYQNYMSAKMGGVIL